MVAEPLGGTFRQPTPLQLMDRVLGETFCGDSWSTWRAVLKAAHALPLDNDELALVTDLTKRASFPTSPVRELWLLLGRRSGKSIIAALLAVWATCCRTYRLAPGEVGIFMIIAATLRQARVIKRYVSGLLRSQPALTALIARETQFAIWLTNGLCIEIHVCSYRSLRGFTCIGAAVDEVAFFDDEDSANPDHEVLVALRAAMASVPDAMLIALTSVYAHRGEVGRMFDRHFGDDRSERVLVVNGPTRAFNPTIEQSVIDEAYEADPMAAAAEYGGQFRRDVEIFLPREALEAVRMPGRLEQPPHGAHRASARAFLDPAGGSGTDSMTLAIAHHERGKAILDVVREVRPPFSPAAVVSAFAQVIRAYGLTTAVSDRYAGTWPTEAFAKLGVRVTPSERTKSQIYQDALPLIMSGSCELLDNPRLFKQLQSLERRTSRSGRDSIDSPPRQNEDLANAACGALVLCGAPARRARMFNAFTGKPISMRAFDPRLKLLGPPSGDPVDWQDDIF